MRKIKISPEKTFTQQAYEIIKDGIIEGQLKPDEKIKIISLKSKLGIGATPIREALSQLVSTGLVYFTDNKGFRVAKASEEEIRDLYSTFTFIENVILEKSFKEGDEKWLKNVLKTFKILNDIESKHEKNLSTWSKANYAFHKALLDGCKSRALLDIQEFTYLKFERYAHMAYKLNPELSKKNHTLEKKEHHEMFVEYARKRDYKKAIELMTYHINAPLIDIIDTLKSKKLI